MIALDTNILLYAIDHDAGARHAAARMVLAEAISTGGVVPLQAVGELFAVTHRKRPDLRSLTLEVVDGLEAACLLPETHLHHQRDAFALAARYRLQYFDALIVAVAASAGADILYSEDMQHGLVAGDMKVVNPFLQLEAGGEGEAPGARV